MARLGWAWRGVAGRGKVQGVAWFVVWLGMAWHGTAWHGRARRGLAWFKVRLGMVRGMAFNRGVIKFKINKQQGALKWPRKI